MDPIEKPSSSTHTSKGEPELAPREHRLLSLLVDTDMSTKEMSHAMKVSYGSVKFYIATLYQKLGVYSSGRIGLMSQKIQRLNRLSDQQEEE